MAESAEHVGAGCGEQVVVAEFWALGEIVQKQNACFGPLGHGHGGGTIELDYRRRLHAEQDIVEGDDLGPVGLSGGAGMGMNSGDGGLDGVGTGADAEG